MQHDPVPSTADLIEKLAGEWHLNVAERRLLNHRVAASQLCEAILRNLRRNGRYPPNWDLGMDFSGGLIKLDLEGRCTIHWKAEIGLERYAEVGIERYADAAKAVVAWLRKTYPTDYDGIQIDWSA